jgi:hypothetical protein
VILSFAARDNPELGMSAGMFILLYTCENKRTRKRQKRKERREVEILY